MLGAARIAPTAIIRPARDVAAAEVVAVAARDPERARRFASKHHIARVHDTYDDLLDDASIDAVYNPLPNGLHGRWTRRALAAGKHVLCEKPFTANASEAEEVAREAERAGLVVMEAFHYRYHPLADAMRSVVAGGELGPIRRVETAMCIPLLRPRDIRFDYGLAGGAVMDVGCYAVHINRLLAGAEPTVEGARAKVIAPRVDRWMRAELRYPDGVEGVVECALLSGIPLRLSARVVGERGELRVFNPTNPHMYYRASVTSGGSRRRLRVDGARTPTYTYQLRAFARAVLRRDPVLTPPADSIANMRVIDAMYDAAGLPRREAEPSGRAG